MCIIAVKPQGLPMFPEEIIKNMANKNKDGGGYMYYDHNLKKVVINKGFMSFEELMEDLKSKDFTDTNLVLHLRIGTSGLRDKLNCHPYPVYDDNRLICSTNLAVAHNGVFSNYHPGWNAKINDTQLFIQKVLRNLDPDFLQDEDKLLLLKELIGTNKLCFLDSNNKVTMLGDFIEDNGYFYSNRSYLPPVEHTTTYYKTSPISLFNSDYYQDLLDEDWGPVIVRDDEDSDEIVETLSFDTEEELVDFLADKIPVDDDLFTDNQFFYSVDLINLFVEKERCY